MEPGEETVIGDSLSADTFTYIGSTGETDNDPLYSSTNTIVQGTSLTQAISDLDASAVTAGGGLSTDNAIARWDGITGTLLQDSGVLIDDFGHILTSGKIYLDGGFDTYIYENPLIVKIAPVNQGCLWFYEEK